MAQSTYQYDDLLRDNFRVLKLEPGSHGVPIKFSLKSHPFNQKPGYEALSYRWTRSDPQDVKSIECGNSKQTIIVGPNLYAALLQLRQSDQPRYLWVDQICINQSKGTEVAHQILRMGDIYSGAIRVLIWLGPATNELNEGVQLLTSTIQNLRTIEGKKGDMLADSHRDGTEEPLKPLLDNNQALIVNKLLTVDWFDRIWTLQEAALANSGVVMCGDKEFNFSELEELINGYENDSVGHWIKTLDAIGEGVGDHDPTNPSRPVNQHVYSIVRLKAFMGNSPDTVPLAWVLNTTRRLNCKKPEDRVRSILHFLPQSLRDYLTRDENMPVVTLYTDLAVWELENHKGLDFLASAGLCHRPRPNRPGPPDNERPLLKLPSWVPDWTFAGVNTYLWVLNNDCLAKTQKALFQASKNSLGRVQHSQAQDSEILRVKGKIIDDEVHDTHEPFTFPVMSKKTRDGGVWGSSQKMSVAEKAAAFSDLGKKDPTVDFIVESFAALNEQIESCKNVTASSGIYENSTIAFRQTLIGGMISANVSSVHGGVIVKATDADADVLFTNWDLAIASQKDAPRFLATMKKMVNPKNLTPEDWEFFQLCMSRTKAIAQTRWPSGYLSTAMSLACKGRRFFVSKKGRFGLVPDIAKPRDKICVFLGCVTPFLIREKGSHFELIGECYVHGLMDGEAMDDVDNRVDWIPLV